MGTIILLKKGSKGDAVAELQSGLTRLGYLTAIDGDFGPQTRANLIAFQSENSLKPDGIYGPLSRAVMEQKLKALPKGKDSTPVSNSETPWMDWLDRNKGQKEISGKAANPFIVDLFRYTSLRNHPMATTDETAWCAACACAALEKNGFKGTNSAAAASFDKYGEAIDKAKYGAVVTLRHPSGGRHVGFFVKYSGNYVVLLGGNQSNMVKESSFGKSEIVAIRWPVAKA